VTLPAATADEANGHIFWLLAKDAAARAALLAHLNARGINAVFHYVPLHSAPAGLRYARAQGNLAVTDDIAARLVRLPMYLGLGEGEVARVIDAIAAFYGRNA